MKKTKARTGNGVKLGWEHEFDPQHQNKYLVQQCMPVIPELRGERTRSSRSPSVMEQVGGQPELHKMLSKKKKKTNQTATKNNPRDQRDGLSSHCCAILVI